jgi:hypothetical protein
MPDVAAILVRDGVLSREAAGKALAAARDGDVASAALRLGFATEGAIVKARALPASRIRRPPGLAS